MIERVRGRPRWAPFRAGWPAFHRSERLVTGHAGPASVDGRPLERGLTSGGAVRVARQHDVHVFESLFGQHVAPSVVQTHSGSSPDVRTAAQLDVRPVERPGSVGFAAVTADRPIFPQISPTGALGGYRFPRIPPRPADTSGHTWTRRGGRRNRNCAGQVGFLEETRW